MVFTRKKARAGANTEYLARTQPGKIYVKEAILDGKSLHGNIIIYSFNKFFNNPRKRKLMN